MTATTITAADAAARAGVTVDTIRHWCRMGAVRATKRAGRWAVDVVSLARRITIGRKALTTKEQTVKIIQPTDIRITVDGDHAYLTAPYNPAANTSYKQIGGRWDGARRAWRFPARDADHVRRILREHFGRADEPVRVVDVRVELEQVADWREQEFWFAGRRIARRPARDSAVQLGEGVLVVEGEFPPAGGSVKYPALEDVDGIVLEIRDVPADHPDLQQDGVTILGGTTGAGLDDETRAALVAEREALMARLAEINALLGDTK